VRVPQPTARALTPADAAAFVRARRQRRETVVFTNGVFDLLHPGHIRYLSDARALGDALIVGVNSDRSVRSNKGPTRPVNRELERVEVLLALSSVDAAVIFDEETPLAVITLLQPDVLVKGADWGPNDIVGRDVVEGGGGRVVRVALAPGFSTTELILRITGTDPPARPAERGKETLWLARPSRQRSSRRSEAEPR
jgi:rfaE bifunctional protein nucleotidyltransferase chain/domain